MKPTRKTIDFCGKKRELYGLHSQSSQEDWKKLYDDLRRPHCVNPEKDRFVVAIDYETTSVKNAYLDQSHEHDNMEHARKLKLHKEGRRKTKPNKKNRGANDVPFDYGNMLVSGISICANADRAFYISFIHSNRDGYEPVVPIANLFDYDDIRRRQREFLEILFSMCPPNTEFVAHNANFEYRVSMVQGFDLFWRNSTRYRGGFICTMLMAKLGNYRKYGLKYLTEIVFDHDQPEYMASIYQNHLVPRISAVMPKVDRHVVDMVKRLVSMVGKGKNPEFTISAINRTVEPWLEDETVAKFKKKIDAMAREVKEEFFDMRANTLTEVFPYAAQDTLCGLHLYRQLARELAVLDTDGSKYCETQWDYYRKIEHPVIRAVAQMSHTGVLINDGHIDNLYHTCIEEEERLIVAVRESVVADMKKRFPKLIGKTWGTDKAKENVRNYMRRESMNLNRSLSHDVSGHGQRPEIADVCDSWVEFLEWVDKLDTSNKRNQNKLLLNILMLPVVKLNPEKKDNTQSPSMDKFALPRYEGFCDTAKRVMDMRKVQQVFSLYVLSYPRLTHPLTGRLHSDFRLSGAATGRFTSSHPNLQQMTKRMKRPIEKKIKVRPAIVTDPDRVILAPDFSQVELRVMSFVSKDPVMMACYSGDDKIDIHTRTCNNVFRSELKKDPSKFKYFRGVAKTINFLCQYGGGPSTLLSNLRAQGVGEFDIDDCRRFIQGFFETYEKVGDFNVINGEDAYSNGYSTSIFGRRRYISAFEDIGAVQRGVRQANNHVIQGSAGDIMKITMARVFWNDYLRSLDVKMHLTIHDELMLTLPQKNLLRALPTIQASFEDYWFNVPIETSVDGGHTFGDLMELEDRSKTIEWARKLCPNVKMLKPSNVVNNWDDEWLKVEEEWT